MGCKEVRMFLKELMGVLRRNRQEFKEEIL
jgi:hypothetical protein